MFKEYGKLSTMVYEHTKPSGHSIDGDIEYFYKNIQKSSGRVLEAGVGTGRMLIPFLEKGIKIDGVDISKEMLEQCKINMKENNVDTNLYLQDLTELSLPNKYETIIMPTGSFCLLPRKKIRQVLIKFLEHLEIGGRIIIDLESPMHFTPGVTSSGSFQIEDNLGILTNNYNENIDWLEQKVSSISKYELVENGTIIETEVSHFTLYWYGIEEFRMLLSEIGFSKINYEVGYGENDHSELITFKASK
ncbi:class I SAM-dependent methyltransferase [Vagococcus sp. DIV0080]|uniref:Class I SAM-dependent methyltransferase n=1 Tax=Candidatus Vagococcus giribetii TaxID=2230876 RepID=A0ABS3HPU3_9ENTE|nr:class I SAM-dependent methyltransferase [Vagococcus sp. DIV0080]MBO0475762.1 class I SAM-dependent methyltransferase [Vagococcus sp. DIV0080]